MARLSIPAVVVTAGILFAPLAAEAADAILPAEYAAKDMVIKADETFAVDPMVHLSTIRVHTLEIKGTLSAKGLGDVGKAHGNGAGLGGGIGNADGGVPGGGAGFLGKGGDGNTLVDAGVCDPFPGATGGPAWLMENQLAKKIGSAGGGSGDDAGSAGGGHLIIYATTITLDGVIDVSGASRVHDDGFPGGGSGGILEIHAWKLEGKGKILARGGDGIKAAAAVVGGGGAGGVVVLDIVNKPGITPDVGGGRSGVSAEGATDAVCGDTGAGADGKVISSTPSKGCIDADGDGFYPPECNPTSKPDDCDDSDPDVHPGVKEVCDGVDNDCNGKVDEGANICGAGKVCNADGNCVTQGQMDAGPPDAGASPDRIDFEGGCDVSPVASATGFAAGVAALTGLALAFRIRRRQRRR